jgi:Tol biopolymer transport system component
VVYLSSQPQRPGIWKVRSDGSGASLLVASADAAHPEASPDGRLVLYHQRVDDTEELRVVRLADGSPAAPPMRVPLTHPEALRAATELSIAIGRGRWRPDGRAVLFVGADEDGRVGIYQQDFVAGADSSATRRLVVPSDGDAITESFGCAPDGSRITVSFREQAANLMVADAVPGVTAQRRR